jgi:hypothetical protein
MKIKIRHNQDTVSIEKDKCTQDEMLNYAIEKINMYYSGHINEVHIGEKIIKFKVKIEQV